MNSHSTPRRMAPRYLLPALGLSLVQALAFAADTQAAESRFDQAMSAYEDGHFVTAARQLNVAASGGDVHALEVLGLMNLYGAPLYGAGPWDKALGRALLRQAADHGSEMAAALLNGSKRHGPTVAAAR